MVVRLWASCAATAALLVSGCFTPTAPPAESIDASANNVFQPVLRGAILASPRSAPNDAQTGHAVELGITRGSGSATQSLSSGYVALGNQQFFAPATLTYDFDFTYVDIAYRWRQVFRASGLGYEALAGVGLADLDFAVRSGNRRASESLSSPGLNVGLGAMWRFWRWTSLHARASGFFSADDNGVSRAARIDAYLSQAVFSNFAVRAGYSSWNVQSDRGDTVSPIDLRFRGPVLGAELMF